MNPQNPRALRAAKLFALLGSASIAALTANANAAAAAAAPALAAAPVEEVLITGSLIAGAPAVGVPVTALGDESWREAGVLSTVDLMKTLPAMEVQEFTGAVFGGGRISGIQNVSIHGQRTGSGTDTLMMINGLRFPLQSATNESVDPSIISRIGIERIDVLTAGASATYGADAVAGVINVILKRNFDGAITQANYSASTDVGSPQYRFAQLYGRTWETGGITVSYDFSNQSEERASSRDYYTRNFEPWGIEDLTPLGSSMPGVVTTGTPTGPAVIPTGFDPRVGSHFCTNCYSLPPGLGWDFDSQAPAATTTWATVAANPGVKNLRNVWLDGDAWGSQQRNNATLTFDQRLFENLYGFGRVALYVDAFYHNRRSNSVFVAPSGNARQTNTPAAGQTIPTNNPYRPTGAPANIRIHYSLAAEVPTRVVGGENGGRYVFGFNFDEMPFDWRGKIFYSMTDDRNFANYPQSINANMVTAAVGSTVASQAVRGTTPGQQAFVKPASIPFLNLFCDTTVFRCNSPATLKYITGFRNQNSHWKVQETGANFDGPVFALPAGPVRTAVGAQHLSHHYRYVQLENASTHSTALILAQPQTYANSSWAVFGQMNIPIFGADYSFPFFESLDVELAYRYDDYDVTEPAYTPKIAFNWGVGYGLTLRGAWGKAHRVAQYGELAGFFGSRDFHLPVNPAAGAADITVRTDCAAVAGNSSPAGVAIPGSLTALLNPTCSAALIAPGGINLAGSPYLREGKLLKPKTAYQWNAGLNFAPTFLPGLVMDVGYFHMRIEDDLANYSAGTGPNDPLSISRYTAVIPNPNLPITDPANASFYSLVLDYARSGQAQFSEADALNVKFILDTGLINIGWIELSGIDFDLRYDWEIGNLGAFNTGVSGYYEIDNRNQEAPELAVTEFYEGVNSGHRLQRARARLGWTNDTFSATLFANYRGHSEEFEHPVPPCYWAPGFSAGSCYPGSPYFPQEGPRFNNTTPSTYLFDLSLGYQTGDMFTNPYLHNINLQLTVNNIFNRTPPFTNGGRRSNDLVAFNTNYSPLQRVISFEVSKTW